MTERQKAERELFGTVFMLAESWKHRMDDMLRPDRLTTKQWMLLMTVEGLGPDAPTLGQAAARYGASHQAVKKLAIRLEKAGFLTLEQDPADRRSVRLRLTPHHYEYWQSRTETHRKDLSNLFSGVDDTALTVTVTALTALFSNSEEQRKS